MKELVLPVIAEKGVYNGVELSDSVIDTILYNYIANPKPIPVKIGHISDNNSKENEIADGVVKSLYKQDGGLYAIVELPEETYRLISEKRLFATSPEIMITEFETGEKNYELIGLALLGNSQPAIEKNYIIHFSRHKPKIFKVVDEDTYISHFKKSDWSENDVYFTTEWNKDKAMKEIVEEKGWETLARCCLAVLYKEGEDTSEYPEAFSRYKFPFAELRDGKLVINSKAVSTAKAYLNGARGVNIDPELADLVEPLVEYLDELVQKAKEKRDKEEMSKRREKELFQRVVSENVYQDKVKTVLEAFERLGFKIENKRR